MFVFIHLFILLVPKLIWRSEPCQLGPLEVPVDVMNVLSPDYYLLRFERKRDILMEAMDLN